MSFSSTWQPRQSLSYFSFISFIKSQAGLGLSKPQSIFTSPLGPSWVRRHGVNPPFRDAAPHFPGSRPVVTGCVLSPFGCLGAPSRLSSVRILLALGPFSLKQPPPSPQISAVSQAPCCCDATPGLSLRVTSSNRSSELLSAFPDLLLFFFFPQRNQT